MKSNGVLAVLSGVSLCYSARQGGQQLKGGGGGIRRVIKINFDLMWWRVSRGFEMGASIII